MDKFLEKKYNLLNLNQEEIDSLNRPITASEIEAVIKKNPKGKKKKQQQLSTGQFHRRILQNI